VVNLAIIEPGYYHAGGSYGFSESGLRLPMECGFRFEILLSAAVLEGKARQHSGRPEYGVRVQLDRDPHSQSQVEATVTIATIPPLKGRMAIAGPTLELLAADLTNLNQISARVVPMEKRRIYEISGLLSLGGRQWFPFQFRVVPTEAETAMSNVVALPQRSA
jgi:hypothetical protein